MSARLQALYEAVETLDSIEDLGALIEAIRATFQVSNVAYVAFSLGGSYTVRAESGLGPLRRDAGLWWRVNNGFGLGAATYSQSWLQRYAEADYHRIDPTVEGASRSFLPIDWKTLQWDTRKKRQFLREAIDCGLGNQGYTIPLRGPDGQFAMFVINDNMSDGAWEKFKSEHASDLLVTAHFFHQKVLEIEKVFGPSPAVQLSAREQDVLRYVASGKSRAQVAHELSISENTLRVYLDSARHKLGALNLTHAVAIGVNRGLISL
jgi:DNA-binding CsgD family transcriptional regulator